MTIKEIEGIIQKIISFRNDDEAQHGLEDALWEAVLVAIADGADDPGPLAAAALKTRELEFARWCA